MTLVATKITIAHADTDSDVEKCFPVMSQLRTHLTKAEFVARVERQRESNYRLAYLEAESRIRAVAGYRIGDCLAWGHFCYVDDLVTDEQDRSLGFGRQLFDWLVDRAKEAGCHQFELDSGVQRCAAHRFYFSQRMSISCYHFSLPLG